MSDRNIYTAWNDRTAEIRRERDARQAQADAAERDRLATQNARILNPRDHHAARAEQFREEAKRREEAKAEKLEAALWARYAAAAPGATREEFERDLPSLIAEHRRAAVAGTAPDLETPANEFADPARWGLR